MNRNKKDSVASIMNPSHGIRDDIRRKGGVPRDHAREYRENLRRIEAENRAKQQEHEEDERRAAEFKLQRFSQATSRVKESINKPRAESEQGSPEPKFLRAHANRTAATGAAKVAQKKAPKSPGSPEHDEEAENRHHHHERRTKSKPAVPRATEAVKMPERHPPKDYLKENAREVIRGAAHKPVKEKEPEPTARDLNREYGEVPEYLRERKQEWAQRQARADAERARHQNCPEGMVLLDEAERLDTLETLNKTKDELTMELRKFPIIVDTYSLQQRKAKLEAKLEDIDEAIDMFSRPHVFITEN